MSERPSREEELFAQVAPLPAAERAAALDRLCAGDAPLRAGIESLLRAHDRSGGFLENAAVTPATAGETPGSRIGRYRIVEKIGEGGCGTVYRAEQEEPVRREVALKIIKAGMDTHAVIARFEAERQALALMEHPNIARVLDAGATSAGRPFFVMELVRGAPITDYCDQQRLPMHARLELFTQICHAIQHAHQKGIIHRDLKPSNVLVARHEERAVPKIIDFGIAKATQGRLGDRTLFTAAEQFVGTPAYMSPEQADGSADVDTRSDIYSLGVLLYELLAGEPPFDPKALRAAGFDEIRRIVREVEPPRPSLRLTTLADATRTTIAERRNTAPLHLATLLRGDLDWIVMRCLEKDRTRRYETAVGLAADIQRHLQHEPISARPPGAAYLVRKFARRHRLAFGSAAAMLAVLVAATGVSTWQAVRATRAEHFAAAQQRLAEERLGAEQRARQDADAQKTRAEQERVRAESERSRAENEQARAEAARKETQAEAAVSRAISDFLRDDLLSQAAPEREPDRDIKLRTVLDRAAQRIEGRFADQPLVEGAIRETLARTYFSLGDYAANQKHLERAIALMKQTRGPEDPRTVAFTANLVSALNAQGKYREAEAFGRENLEKISRAYGPESPQTIAAMNNLAIACSRVGKANEAGELLEKSLAIQQRLLGDDHPRTQVALNNLGNHYRLLRRFDDAEKIHRQLLEIRLRTLGPDRPETLGVRLNLAILAMERRREPEAESLFTSLLADQRRVLGPEHPETLGTARCLGIVYRRLGRLQDAETILAQTAESEKRALGAEHPRTILTLVDLASVYRDQKRPAEAEELLTKLLPLFRRAYSPEHAATQDAAMVLVDIYQMQNRREEAEKLMLDVFAQLGRAPASPAVRGRQREVARRLQQFYEAAGQTETARDWKQRADAFVPAGTAPP